MQLCIDILSMEGLIKLNNVMSQINTSYLDVIYSRCFERQGNIDGWFGLGDMFVQQINDCFVKATKCLWNKNT
jgi:hypothetical protein